MVARITGHFLRRTAISIAANAGLTLVQLKALSGHKSDAVVQQYICKSDHMRNITAAATMGDDAVQQVAKKHKIEAIQEVSASDPAIARIAPVINYYFNGANITGSVSIGH